MASIRELKKDIDFLSTEIISECYFRMMMLENADKSTLTATISQAMAFRNDFISRANHPDGKKNPQLVKEYYRSLRKELVTKFSEMVEVMARQ
jgi:hypothetical protein